MNALPANVESWWRTYLKAAAFLLPPVTIWALSCVFVFPKLKTLWRDTGFMDDTMQGFIRASDFFMEHGVLIGVGVIALLGLLEWRKGVWPRYRKVSVGTLVFVLNGAVLLLIFYDDVLGRHRRRRLVAAEVTGFNAKTQRRKDAEAQR